MRAKLILFALAVLLKAGVQAQHARPNMPRVVESSAKAWVRSQSIRLELPISGSNRPLIVRTNLLDPSGAQIDSRKETLVPGQTKLVQTFVLPKEVSEEEMPWLRAKYALELNGKVIARGIVTVGALDKSLYQLKLAHPRTLTPGQRFSARVRALNPVTRAAVPGVKLTATLELDGDDDSKRNLTRRLVTNKNGEAQIAFNVPNEPITDATLRVGSEPSTSLSKGANDDAWDPEATADIDVAKPVRKVPSRSGVR